MRVGETLKPALLAALIALAALVQARQAKSQEQAVLTVAGGCFWCVEADFERVPGVIEAISGYTGGTVANPTYKQVTGGNTGHYEAVQIRFDPSKVSRRQLLELFVRSIDPTDAGGQFCDRGDSYRSAVFAQDAGEAALARQVLKEAQKALGRKVVTPVMEARPFFRAEDYHQDYYKGTDLVFTRYGPKRQAAAYKRYREACGRDTRVTELWGDAAPFAAGH
ncbi:peptide-methionine (S)-S-oxide reductase MsrA [Cribrihabitans neustonicus]|uniref:peptide-methionine (S)-S-oxide reductase MsrA n=1 Tax=Cribrihabitans neustonicus TaxID=1429085 RepID=UPI003B5A2FED